MPLCLWVFLGPTGYQLLPCEGGSPYPDPRDRKKKWVDPRIAIKDQSKVLFADVGLPRFIRLRSHLDWDTKRLEETEWLLCYLARGSHDKLTPGDPSAPWTMHSD